MTSPIFLLKKDDEIRQLDPKMYEKEEVLHSLLATHPNLLFSDYPDLNDIGLLLIKNEAPTYESEEAVRPSWLDILLIGNDCIPVFIEVKLSTNPEIRRTIVGQVMEYAGNAVANWKLEDLQEMFRQTCAIQKRDATEALAEFLGPDKNLDEFWDTAYTNLRAGKIRIVFASDAIPPSLKNIVRFLRNQMKPAVILAVDIPQFISEEHQVVVPKVFGQTIQQTGIKGTVQKRKWNEADFMAALQNTTSEDEVRVAKQILTWAQDRKLRIWWGEGTQEGSFYPLLDFKQGQYQVIAVRTSGRSDFEFGRLKGYTAFASDEQRLKFLEMINAIPGMNIPEKKIAGYPSFTLSTLKDPQVFDQFVRVLDYFLAQIRGT
ncbi:MAG: hypothetical protein M0R30_05715 [Methanoregula sp.]|jgi:hypothetical protein|uniref:hypothetical protein n=1 Tax=Methanoregula sp. TaxID=2052170 RepID=UPI0025EF5B79|nr:hypothetical protein [Methanoregula sp.]MCK9631123.1 hypothetical protein [Methanoregula sp.]